MNQSQEASELTAAIAALEGQRAILGDAVIDAALGPMRKRLDELAVATQPEQQRKMATILFADVSGFTALSETMDAELVAEVMNDLWALVDQAIIDHGGRIDKHIGDAVMALWGAETAREDDPEQAIRAALDMQAAGSSPAISALWLARTRGHPISSPPASLRRVMTAGPGMPGWTTRPSLRWCPRPVAEHPRPARLSCSSRPCPPVPIHGAFGPKKPGF